MEKQLLDFITKEFVNDDVGEPLTINSDLLMSGIIDSMGVMLLTSFIEKEYLITIPPEDVLIENFINVSAIINYIKSRKTLEV